MASDAQIKANRQNAKKSTGPRSPEGKAKSSANATTHGLAAELVCVPGEDSSVFEARRDELFTFYKPEGPEERQLVERIAFLEWKLERVPRAEAALVTERYWDRRYWEHDWALDEIERDTEEPYRSERNDYLEEVPLSLARTNNAMIKPFPSEIRQIRSGIQQP